MKLHKKLAILFIIVTVLSSGPLLFLLLNSPHNRLSGARFCVHQGESVKTVARNLKDSGFIRSALFFTGLVRVRHDTGNIKSGEYTLSPNLKTTKIIDMFTRGVVVTQKFTIPEGLTVKQVAAQLERNEIVHSEDFIKACSNKAFMHKYGIPFESAEGFLFPDTYIVAKGLSAGQLVDIMIERFFKGIIQIPFTHYSADELKRVVIIASLVEREAKVDDERALIAAVFYNRLKQNKRLESCATVQYILGKTKERLLYSDLKFDSPYNTYLHTGLPPGPIANPGIKSIEAAIFPADVDYLFFVSKKDGTHFFSSTYQEHLEAIKKYNRTGSIGHQIS